MVYNGMEILIKDIKNVVKIWISSLSPLAESYKIAIITE